MNTTNNYKISKYLDYQGLIHYHNKLLKSLNDDFASNLVYDKIGKKIYLRSKSNELLATIDATDFIKDGMVSNVYIRNQQLIIEFNTDSGKETISINLSDIFNPDNYYDKFKIDSKLAKKQDTLISGENVKTINNQSILGSGNIEITLNVPEWALQPTKPTYTASEVGAVSTSDFNTAVDQLSRSIQTETLLRQQADSNKQNTLVSGENIKTINNESLLGSGNITLNVQQEKSDWSENDSTKKSYILNRTHYDISPSVSLKISSTDSRYHSFGFDSSDLYSMLSDLYLEGDQIKIEFNNEAQNLYIGQYSDSSGIYYCVGSYSEVQQIIVNKDVYRDTDFILFKVQADGSIYGSFDQSLNINTEYDLNIWNGTNTVVQLPERFVSYKQDKLIFDNIPTKNSNNPVKSSGLYPYTVNVDTLLDIILGGSTQIGTPQNIWEDGTLSASINPEIIQVFENVETLTIELTAPTNNMSHLYTILLSTSSNSNITFSVSDSSQIIFPSDYEIEDNKTYEISILYVNSKYYLKYVENQEA